MIQRCNRLYQDLERELGKCRNEGLPFITETEHCFYIAENYRGLLRESLAGYSFQSIEEEIQYFKNIKPKFIAECEYASLLNFGGSFCPSTDLAEKIQFWTRQVNRLEKFQHNQKEFYFYYSSFQTHLDCVQFVSYHPSGNKIFADRTRNDYDLLTGQLIARQRYAVFAGKKLNELKEARK